MRTTQVKKYKLFSIFYVRKKMISELNRFKINHSEMEFKEFEPRVKSAKTRFKFSAGLNLETFDTILTNHI